MSVKNKSNKIYLPRLLYEFYFVEKTIVLECLTLSQLLRSPAQLKFTKNQNSSESKRRQTAVNFYSKIL